MEPSKGKGYGLYPRRNDGISEPRACLHIWDFVQFNAAYILDLKANKRQRPGKLVPGKYEVVGIEGDEISLNHVDG